MTEAQRQRFDSAMRKYGPNKDQTLDEVEARLDRQVTADALVDALVEWHGKTSKYRDPMDWSRQVATALLFEFNVRRIPPTEEPAT